MRYDQSFFYILAVFLMAFVDQSFLKHQLVKFELIISEAEKRINDIGYKAFAQTDIRQLWSLVAVYTSLLQEFQIQTPAKFLQWLKSIAKTEPEWVEDWIFLESRHNQLLIDVDRHLPDHLQQEHLEIGENLKELSEVKLVDSASNESICIRDIFNRFQSEVLLISFVRHLA